MDKRKKIKYCVLRWYGDYRTQNWRQKTFEQNTITIKTVKLCLGLACHRQAKQSKKDPEEVRKRDGERQRAFMLDSLFENFIAAIAVGLSEFLYTYLTKKLISDKLFVSIGEVECVRLTFFPLFVCFYGISLLLLLPQLLFASACSLANRSKRCQIPNTANLWLMALIFQLNNCFGDYNYDYSMTTPTRQTFTAYIPMKS